jgi:hypothetical protein
MSEEELERFKEQLDFRYTLNLQIDRIVKAVDPYQYYFYVSALTDMLLPYMDDKFDEETLPVYNELHELEDAYRKHIADAIRMYWFRESNRLIDALNCDRVAYMRQIFRALIKLMDRKGLLLTGREKAEKIG